MADVARRAGVHAATVSRALRDDPRISLPQRARVQQAARELGYRTNPLVAALMRTRRSGRAAAGHATLAYLTRYPAERAGIFARDFGLILAGARERAQSQGYRIEEFNLQAPGLNARRATEILLSRNIRGLLIAPLHSVHEPVALEWEHFCAVAIGYSFQAAPVSRVVHNHFSSFSQAARRCRELGRERIGLVLQRRVHEKVDKRWLAAALLDQAEQPPTRRIAPLLFDELQEGEFASWFRQHEPDAILGLDVSTLGAWLHSLGKRIPDDVGLVSLDRRPTDHGIAGIDQDYAGRGANGVDLLVGLLQRNERGLAARPLTVLSDGTWIDGPSLETPDPRR